MIRNPRGHSGRMSRRTAPSGFTLVELLVAMVVMTVVGGGLAGLLISQLDFQRAEDTRRDSRSTARAALNVLTSDLRMVESEGGVAAAAPRDITVRVPYSYGVICASSPAATIVSLLPSDSTAFMSAGRSGWAWRDANTGSWNYQEIALTLTVGGAAACTAAQVAVLPAGRALTIAPGAAGLTIGTPAMLYQTRRRFPGETHSFERSRPRVRNPSWYRHSPPPRVSGSTPTGTTMRKTRFPPTYRTSWGSRSPWTRKAWPILRFEVRPSRSRSPLRSSSRTSPTNYA